MQLALVPRDIEGLEIQNMTLLSLLQEILLCSSSARYRNVAGQICQQVDWRGWKRGPFTGCL